MVVHVVARVIAVGVAPVVSVHVARAVTQLLAVLVVLVVVIVVAAVAALDEHALQRVQDAHDSCDIGWTWLWSQMLDLGVDVRSSVAVCVSPGCIVWLDDVRREMLMREGVVEGEKGCAICRYRLFVELGRSRSL